MKQAEQPRVVVNLENVLAGRIATQFRNVREQQILVKKFDGAIQDARHNHPQAPDDALIPVTVHITEKEARTILQEFKPYIGAPHDAKVYKAVSDALKANDES
jgi:hypothetical protein